MFLRASIQPLIDQKRYMGACQDLILYPKCLVGTPHSSTSSGESVSFAANKIHHQGTAPENLSNELAIWCKWLANESSQYAAYRAFNYKRSVALEKQPGVRPLAIGEVWMQMWAKEVLQRQERKPILPAAVLNCALV